MDLLSLLGVIVGFAAIIGGNFLEGGHLSGLYNLPAVMEGELDDFIQALLVADEAAKLAAASNGQS